MSAAVLTTLAPSSGQAATAESTAAATEALVMHPQSSKSAMFRYWIDAAMPLSRAGGEAAIMRDLADIAANGYAGIEFNTLMQGGETTAELEQYGWATPAFVKLLKAVLRKASAYGLRVDMTATAGWPIIIPGIESSNAREQELYFGGTTGNITGATSETLSSQASGQMLEAVTAVKVTGSVRVHKGAQEYVWGTTDIAGLTSNPAVLVDPDALVVLTEGTDYTYDSSAGTVTLDWTPPSSGAWRVLSYWRGYGTSVVGGSGQFGAVAGTSYYTNYLSVDGAEAYIRFMDKHFFSDPELADLMAKCDTHFFADSLEFGNYFGQTMLQWSADFRASWKRRLGYDVTPYIPLLQGIQNGGAVNVEYYDYEFPDAAGGYSNAADRLRDDYKQLVTELFINAHVRPIQDWLAKKKLSYKFQTYSYSFDVPALAASVAQPEVETLGFSNLPDSEDKMRLMTGGASSGGRNVISSELALNDAGYQTTFASAMETVGQQYGLGMNWVYWHGFPSTGVSSSAWPGWSVFGTSLGDYWGPRQTTWSTERDFAGYLARTQQVLRAGVRKVDLAVLTDRYGTYTPIWTDTTLANSGFSYEFVTRNTLQLPTAKVHGGRLNPDYAGYKR